MSLSLNNILMISVYDCDDQKLMWYAGDEYTITRKGKMGFSFQERESEGR